MLVNQMNGHSSFVFVVAAMAMFPIAAVTEEAGADDEQEQGTHINEIVSTAHSLNSADILTAIPVQILPNEELRTLFKADWAKRLVADVHLGNSTATLRVR